MDWPGLSRYLPDVATVHVATCEAAAGSRFERSGWFFLSAVPGVASLLLVGFAYHTSRATGVWPSYGSPDPSTANAWLYRATLAAYLLSIPSIVTLGVGLPIVRRLRLERTDVAAMLIGLVGLGFLVFLWSGNLGSWVAD